jgi:hypothetical protein
MHFVLILVLALHALSGVFWAGSTFVLARGAAALPPLLGPQARAAGGAVLTGAILWGLLHRGGFGVRELPLAVGACAALLAAAVQFASARALNNGSNDDAARAKPLTGQRAAAGLLALTLLAMVLWRWV